MPEAMTLATATKEGRPSARMVLLKGADREGFRFHTNFESRKGRELAGNPHAALVFHWPASGRQVRVEGDVRRAPDAESEAYFSTRPHGGRVSAWASPQSAVVESRKALEAAVAGVAARFGDGDVPLPPFWGGFVLKPSELEFWEHGDDRLHDRFRYRREPSGAWTIERLAP